MSAKNFGPRTLKLKPLKPLLHVIALKKNNLFDFRIYFHIVTWKTTETVLSHTWGF